MDLQINNQAFLVCGATSGFGKGTATALLNEGAKVIGVARKEEGLNEMAYKFGDRFIAVKGDITTSQTIEKAIKAAKTHDISGVLVNAGGPPALNFQETTLENWDEAYRSLLRWKVELTQKLLPHFTQKAYGRFVFVESASVKQPIENLVLSTSLRLSVVGFVKTLTQEIDIPGITFNIVGPGSHETPAINRLIKKASEKQDIPFEEAKAAMTEKLPVKKMGNPDYLGSLAAWLLSPLSEFVTGQVYAIEGGSVKSTL